MQSAPSTLASGLSLLARAEKAERELAHARATLAEHVDENLRLHARVADLEERTATAEALLETTRDAAQVAVTKAAELERKLALIPGPRSSDC